MISNKIKVAILIIILIIAILIIRNVVIENQSSNENERETVAEIKFDEGNQIYYIEDANGMVLHESYSEDELYIYQIDPGYNPQNPDMPDEYGEYTE